MIRSLSILALGAASCALALPLAAAAQTFERIEARNPWNASQNAAGLRADSLTISEAVLAGRIEGGGLRGVSDPVRLWEAEASARTITHLERISLGGSFSFTQQSGSDMCGSMFIHPGFYPIDAIEFTPGRKDLQRYAFTGTIAAPLGSRWTLGAHVGFEATNQAKRKDLRHTNYRMELSVAPAAVYRSRNVAVGIAYLFARNSERIKAEEIGSKETYYAFLDKGLMQGAYEVWTGSGTHLDEAGVDGLPLSEITHGAALQLHAGRFFAEATYRHGKGRTGEKQTTWFEFPSERADARLEVDLSGRGKVRRLTFTADYRRQTNDETILGRETSGGITTTTRYGSMRIFERRMFLATADYVVGTERLDYAFGAQYATLDRMSSQMYPYLFAQESMYGEVYAALAVRTGGWRFGARLACSDGTHDDYRSDVDTSIEAGEAPYSLTEWYLRENEYLSARRLSARLAVRYTFPRRIFVEAGGELTHAFGLRLSPGSDRLSGTLLLGYTF